MKIVATSKVREILKKQYKQLKHIWIFDKKLVLLPSGQIDSILKGIDVYKRQFKDELFDCDDFALVTNAFVKLKVASLQFPHNWAFGECSLMYSDGEIHNQNIFISENLEVRLFEPQTNKIILPGKGETVFYVRM